jgi:GT2 family glycosyltransferase
MPSSFVSVVVCVYNDEAYIKDCLISLTRQTYPDDRYEIIVVDDGSTDRSGEIVRSFSDITYIWQQNLGPSAARNTGIQVSRGDLIAFTDSDCVACETWLESLARCFEHASEEHAVAGVGGAQRGHPADGEFAQKVQAFLRAVGFVGDYVKPYSEVREVSHNASCNSSYRAEFLRRVGGFREHMYPGEDVDLDRRLRNLGYAIIFTPHALVYHHRPSARKEWLRMLRNYGKASAQNLLFHGPFRVVQVIPVFLVLAICILSVSLCLWPGPSLCVATVTVAMVLIVLKKRSRLGLWDTTRFATETLLFFCLGYFVSCFRELLRIKPSGVKEGD